MSTAIVTGATGILGREIVRHLGQNPQAWPTVHALSRQQKESYPPNIIHDTIDLFATDTDGLVKELLEGSLKETITSGGVEYIFFSAYLARDDEAEAARVNAGMLKNFLQALHRTGGDKNLKRVILTTGAKQYGVHLGPVKLPMEEDDPWVEEGDGGRPPNFYYAQQRVLWEQQRGKKWDWVVTFPNDVIGVAKGNFMNLTTAIGVYASITKELNEPFIFPGSPFFYTGLDTFTSSALHADFALWAAKSPHAGNQTFNVVNGDVQSWQTLWPRLADRFGVTIPADQFSSSSGSSSRKNEMPHHGSVTQLIEKPPLINQATSMGIEGRVPRGEVRAHIDLSQWWCKRPEVKEAWQKLASREGLEKDAFEKATWQFLNFIMGRNYNIVINMNKARKLGYQGWADTWDSLAGALDELERQRILPRRK